LGGGGSASPEPPEVEPRAESALPAKADSRKANPREECQGDGTPGRSDPAFTLTTKLDSGGYAESSLSTPPLRHEAGGARCLAFLVR